MAALERLQMEYVDLVFCHRPDVETPIEETVRAMSYLVENGYAFYWGTSEWSAEQIRHAYEVARREHLVPPTMEQPQYNMFHRERVEREYAPLYDDIGLGTTIWSPLGSGLLTGKYNDGIPDDSRLATEGYEWLQDQVLVEERLEKVAMLSDVADDLGCTTAQLALAWCLLNENVSTVITGATKPAQVEENMQALDVVDQIDSAVASRIESILDNKPDAAPNFRQQ
jgi:voltage-dependent potassium channel beta subunit